MIHSRLMLGIASGLLVSSPVFAEANNSKSGTNPAAKLSLSQNQNNPNDNYGATQGNGQGNGHEKGVGNGHNKGRGNGHHKYDEKPDSN